MALREVLKRNRIDQSELAVAIGVTRNAVWNWCNAISRPTADNLLKARDWIRQYDPTVTADDLLESPEPDAVDMPVATIAPGPDAA